ncbi:MAG: NADPH:quinone reductase [Pseudomonadota bacterium]
MKAALYRRCGPAEDVLSLEALADPEPEPGDVLVELHVSGINPADVKRRAGWRGLRMEHARIVPHADGAGRIVAVGAGIDRSRIGQRVWLYNAQGGYGETGRADGTAAEFVSLPSRQAVPLPDALSYAEGACLGIPAVTAHHAVFADGPVDGKVVLVAGAGGAVGHFAVQFARAGGARVIGTTSSSLRKSHALDAGASDVADRHAPDLAAALHDLSAGGFDRIVEVDFGANIEMDLELLRPHGVIASYSSTSRPEPALPYYALQNKGGIIRSIQGFNIPAKARCQAEARIAVLAREGRLQVAVGASVSLEKIVQAHQLVEAGATIGNVVLTLR